MPPKNLIDIHEESIKHFDDVQTALQDERYQCLEDRRFYSISGAQWEGELGEQFENKPRFEVNKVHLSVIRIINEYRNNRITVAFTPKDGADDNFSDVCNGRYRADEQDSNANEAYDNAFEEAVAGGIGAWRVTPVDEDEDDEDNEYQRIRIEPIYDADNSVYFDLGAKRQDKSDAHCCWVVSSIPRDEYEKKFGDDPASWPKDMRQTQFDWQTPDIVFIAEYYVIEYVSEKIEIWQDLEGNEEQYNKDDFNDNEDLFMALTATGWRKTGDKIKKTKRCHKYLMSGGKILRDEGYLPGKNIPIVINYGKRWFVDNIERCMGHVRLSKDAQRLKNMQLSKLGEIAGMSAVEKPIVTPEQIAGHENMWSEDNIKNYPYLLINPMTDLNGNLSVSGPTAYTKPPQVPPAMAALLQITEQDMVDLLGNQQAGETVTPNVSAKAVELIQNKLDMQTHIYMSNMKKAVKRCGEIWLSMAKEIYIEENRNIKILNPQREPASIQLNKPVIDPETGAKVYENDFEVAKYDVDVQVGPSTSTKRAATVRELTGMIQMTTDPETQIILSSMALMNMEGEGIEDIRKYMRRKLIRMGVIEPNEQELKELQQEAQAAQQPDPQSIYLQAAAKEAEAKALKSQADTMLIAAKTEETKADTAKTLSEIDQKEREQTVSTIKQLTDIQNQQATPAMPQQVSP